MGVASHLGIKLDDYDRSIRTFIPHYEDMLDAAAEAVASMAGRSPRVLDLGTGSGALAGRVLAAVPGARVTGIDADDGMLGLAQKRLRGRLAPMVGDFLSTQLPPCDVITASFSLHHVASRKQKAALYRRGFKALAAHGILVNADCCLSSSPRLQVRDRARWHQHLARTYGRSKAEGFLRAWAKEDFYLTLEMEVELLGAAGFSVDVVWRRDGFATIAARK
jgi:SAM-dependent methyltransferase